MVGDARKYDCFVMYFGFGEICWCVWMLSNGKFIGDEWYGQGAGAASKIRTCGDTLWCGFAVATVLLLVSEMVEQVFNSVNLRTSEMK